MPLDPQAKSILKALEALNEPPVTTVSPAVSRIHFESRKRESGPSISKISEYLIPSTNGGIQTRIYTPEGQGPFPILVWFHGGGWVLGNLNTTESECRNLTNLAKCVVVSVDYRLAPESKFPAAAEDCYTATKWISDHPTSFNVDAQRMAIGGASSGGNLAAVVTLMSRDRNGPKLLHQLLVVPVTDYDFNTESYIQNESGYGLTREAMIWYWRQYLNSEADSHNPYAVPMREKDLSGLPNATIITAEFDPLRDEAEAYAKRLEEAGTKTTCARYDGMIHGFFGMSESINKTRDAIKQAADELKNSFAEQH